MQLKKQVTNALSSFVRRKDCHQQSCSKGKVICDPISKISSTSTASTVSDDDSFHSDSSITDQNLRSKSSLKSNSKILVRSKKSVHFHEKKNQLNIVEPYFAYRCDLWWSKEEMNKCRIDNGIELSEYSHDELRGIREYTNTYHRVRQHATITKQHQQHQDERKISLPSEILSKSKVVISNDDYQIIVHGKACGWDGLEELLPMNKALSSTERTTRDIVCTIVDEYHNNRQNKQDADRALRSLSKSLTSSDRSWAVIMGTAECDALKIK